MTDIHKRYLYTSGVGTAGWGGGGGGGGGGATGPPIFQKGGPGNNQA